MPTTRCITRVSTWCSTSPAVRVCIGEAGGEPLGQPNGAIGLAQQQRAGIRGDRAAIEARHHSAAFDGWKIEQCEVTLCWHWGFLWFRENRDCNTILSESMPQCT